MSGMFLPGGAHVWLTVYPAGATLGESGALYTKDVPLGFLPAVGEQIALWADDEDEGPLWEVKRRYWNGHGTANLTMMDARIDADKIDHHYERRWETSTDGDLPALLLAGGWHVY